MTTEALPQPATKVRRLPRIATNPRLARARHLVTVDVRRWWLHTINPPALGTWLTSREPKRIPGNDTRLALAWRIDHHTTGIALAGLSVALFLAAAGIRWCGLHPARRWLLLALTCAAVAWALA